MDLELSQLRAFVAVVDAGGFGAAASRLHLTQQAVSKRVARLEATLGDLLERRPEGVELTPRGHELLDGARDLLERADALADRLRATPAPPLRADVWGHVHRPHALVETWGREHPDVGVEMSMRRSLVQAVHAIERGELDVAFGNADALAPLPPGLASERVTTVELVGLVHLDGPFAGARTLAAEALRGATLGWPAGDSAAESRVVVDAYAAAHGLTIQTAGANLGLDAHVRWIEADRGRASFVDPAWPLPADARVRAVRVRPAPQFTWHGVWRTRGPHPWAARLVRGVARAAGD